MTAGDASRSGYGVVVAASATMPPWGREDGGERVEGRMRERLRATLARLHSGEPLPACLRECIKVGVDHDADQLLAWARYELTGYPDNSEVPDYRRLPVDLIGIRRTDQFEQIGPVGLDEYESETRDWILTNRQSVRYTVDDIAASLRRARENHESYIIASLIADQHRLLKPGRDIYTQVYWGVSAAAFSKILDDVRATAIGMLKVLDTPSTQPAEAEEPEAAAAQAIHVHIGGSGHQVRVTAHRNHARDAGPGAGDDLARKGLALTKWQVYLAAIGLPIAVISAVFAYLALQPGPSHGDDKAKSNTGTQGSPHPGQTSSKAAIAPSMASGSIETPRPAGTCGKATQTQLFTGTVDNLQPGHEVRLLVIFPQGGSYFPSNHPLSIAWDGTWSQVMEMGSPDDTGNFTLLLADLGPSAARSTESYFQSREGKGHFGLPRDMIDGDTRVLDSACMTRI